MKEKKTDTLCEKTKEQGGNERAGNTDKKSGKEGKCISRIGGQALMEGVMMRGVGSMAMAVRAPEGEILLETKRLKSTRKWYKKMPILRGLIAFFDSMVSGVSTLMRSAEVSGAEEEVPSKAWMGFAVFLGLALGVGLFILLPSFICSLLFDIILKLNGYSLLKSLAEGVLRILIFVLYLFLVSRLKDIKRTFMYHGAEHRTINCYEKGMDLTVENVQKCSTRHNRCGTTFLFFVMLISILLFSLAQWVFERMGITAENYGQIANIFIKFGIRLALLPIVAGLSYELLRFLALLPDNFIVAVFRAPGLALQRLTTYPPTDDMAEVALKSFKAVMEMDEDASISEIKFGEYSVKALKKYIQDELKNTNADESEADWILSDVFKKKRANLHEAGNCGLKEYNQIKAYLKRRKEGEPLWYILGYTDFYANRIKLSRDVLIPRSETELLCECAIKHIGDRPLKALDLCTGSGCIALSILKNTPAIVTAADISEKALETARLNLTDKATIIQSDMFKAFNNNDKFDIIVSNPPYIETNVIETLDKEIKDFEPKSALDGGTDGLDFYRTIANEAHNHLTENGVLMLEIGYNQAESVTALLSKNYKTVETLKDYSDCNRIIIAKK